MERYLRHHGSWLLALIVALDEPVTTDFAKVSVECLGYAFQLPPIIKRVGVSSPLFIHKWHEHLIMRCVWKVQEEIEQEAATVKNHSEN